MRLTSERYVAWTVRHGRLLWTIALLLAIPATWRTVDLYAHLKSDFEKLLPRASPSVKALEELRSRLASDRFLGVVVDAGDAAHLSDANRFIDDLVARIRTYPDGMVRSIDIGGNADEDNFFRKNAPLYVDTEDLETIYERVRDRRRWEAMRATFGSIDEGEEPPSLDFSDLRAKYDWAMAHGAATGDRYASPELHLSLALLRVGTDVDGHELYKRLVGDVNALNIVSYAPGMRVGFSGDIAATTEETEALLTDLSFASVLVILAVTFVIVAYYRWWRAVLALMPPVLLAMVYAFALASLPPFSVTELNSNTAFLGSIIIGNGINVGIILVARYVEERRRGTSVTHSLETGVGASYGGTLAAAAAAGVAYASLGITQFRGFRQFGAIGGLGMLFAWTLAYVLTPSLLARLDNSETTRPRAVKTAAFSHLSGLAAFISRYYVLVLFVTAIAAALSVREVLRIDRHVLESDFSKLRRSDTWDKGEGYWGNRMNDLLGRYLSPLVILTDSPDDADAIADNLRSRLHEEPFAGSLATVRTAADLVPSDQARKVELVGKLRGLIGATVLEGLPPSDRDLVSSFLGQRELRPITLEDVPVSIREALRERDGSTGKVVLIYPSVSGEALWDGDRLSGLVHGLRDIATTSVAKGRAPGRVAGGLPLSADILAAIGDDGRITCIFAFLGVIAVVALIVRRVGTTALIITSLSLGVLFQLAAMLLFHIKLNFANFIAFPITFGVGADYAVNIMTRYVHDGRRSIQGAVAATGGAVVLASLTTIIGYASLLVAKNQALFLFGALAVIGEIACLGTAIVVLPSVLVAIGKRKHEPLRQGPPP